VRRLFWFGLGAAAGFYVARRGEQLVDDARERGAVGTLSAVAATAGRAATTAARTAVSVGESAGSAARQRVAAGAATATARPAPSPGPTPLPSRTGVKGTT
jgi:hypothetical protein